MFNVYIVFIFFMKYQLGNIDPELANHFRSPGIDSQLPGLQRLAESIPGLLKRLQIQALYRAHEGEGVGGVTLPTPFYSRLLNRYLKTT